MKRNKKRKKILSNLLMLCELNWFKVHLREREGKLSFIIVSMRARGSNNSNDALVQGLPFYGR